ncbi:MAG: hypothetical protein ACREFP_18285 [Acetobacteraceae bacterium]
MRSHDDLDARALAVFRQALAAGRHDVAERPLRALEAIDRCSSAGSALDEAYVSIAASQTEASSTPR